MIRTFVRSVAFLLLNGVAAAAEPTVITLQRTECFGTCPAYAVSASSDGRILYRGDRHVAAVGLREATVSAQDMRRLLKEFDEAKFDELRGDYFKGSEGCEYFATDNPTQIITIIRDGKEKRVEYYFGCSGTKIDADLTRLRKLGDAIDEILDTAQWVGTVEPKWQQTGMR